MSDEGYTLAEMLVALALAALATGAISSAARLVARAEDRVKTSHATSLQLSRLQARAGAAIGGSGPFLARGEGGERLEGVSDRVRFDCLDGASCELRLDAGAAAFTDGGAERRYRLTGLKRPSLQYVSAVDGRATTTWPVADRPDRLGAVALVEAGGAVVILPVARQQAAVCVFDLGAADCVRGGDR